MEQHRLAHEITRIAEPVVRALGLALWGIEFIHSGRTVLRMYVDSPPGARDIPAARPDTDEAARTVDGSGPSIGQCAKISRHIALALDAEDIIPYAYVLEVSSPGLERPFFALAQLAPYVGSDVTLKLGSIQPELPDRKCLRGRLQAVGEQDFTLLAYDAPAGTLLSIRWDNVRKAMLAPELPFSKSDKRGKKKSAPKAGAASK